MYDSNQVSITNRRYNVAKSLARVVAIALQKGGTGKTTTALCLAGGLVLKNKKVLLMDLDPQGNASNSLVDMNYLRESSTLTSLDVLTRPEISLAECIMETASGIYLVPANSRLAMAEQQLAMIRFRETVLSKKFAAFLEETSNETDGEAAFDYCLLDCPPSLGMLTINALAAATDIILPVETGEFSLQGLSDFLETYREMQQVNSKLRLTGVLLTMVDNTRTSKDVAANVKEILPKEMFKSQISRRTILSQVPTRGPIQLYAPNSDSANEYNALAEEVIRATT